MFITRLICQSPLSAFRGFSQYPVYFVNVHKWSLRQRYLALLSCGHGGENLESFWRWTIYDTLADNVSALF